MAQNPEVLVATSGWTQLTSLANATLVELTNKSSEEFGVLIQTADPGASVPWTAGKPVQPNRGEWMFRKGASDVVWGRAATTLQTTGTGTQVFEAVVT